MAKDEQQRWVVRSCEGHRLVLVAPDEETARRLAVERWRANGLVGYLWVESVRPWSR